MSKDQFICGDKPLKLNVITIGNIQLEWKNVENTKEITISESGIYWAKATYFSYILSDTIWIEKRELTFDTQELEEFWDGKTKESYKSSSTFQWIIKYSC